MDLEINIVWGEDCGFILPSSRGLSQKQLEQGLRVDQEENPGG